MRVLRLLGYLCLPLAFIVHTAGARQTAWEPTATFTLAAIGMIPLARLMGLATAQLADRSGPTIGGLLNATFGNACELIIGIIGLTKGLGSFVKASLTGSILGNLLLVSGGAMLVGGWNRERQLFSRAAAQTNGSLLAVAVVALLFPAIYHFSFQARDMELRAHEMGMSIGTSIILMTIYGLGLLFTLRTHSHIFSLPPALTDEQPGGLSSLGPPWTVRRSMLVLLIASIAIAALSELLTGTVEAAAHRLGWNDVFIGIVVIAIIGNAAEHSTAIYLAHRNDMETAMSITYQSSLQIALFAMPLLVLISCILAAAGVPGVSRLDLVFTPLEAAAVLLSVAIVIVISVNGETNWFEGALLLGVYAILAITFFYIPLAHHDGYDRGDGVKTIGQEIHGTAGK